jgi:hypothetical protein
MQSWYLEIRTRRRTIKPGYKHAKTATAYTPTYAGLKIAYTPHRENILSEQRMLLVQKKINVSLLSTCNNKTFNRPHTAVKTAILCASVSDTPGVQILPERKFSLSHQGLNSNPDFFN